MKKLNPLGPPGLRKKYSGIYIGAEAITLESVSFLSFLLGKLHLECKV
jgi:hypothetical protein